MASQSGAVVSVGGGTGAGIAAGNAVSVGKSSECIFIGGGNEVVGVVVEIVGVEVEIVGVEVVTVTVVGEVVGLLGTVLSSEASCC